LSGLQWGIDGFVEALFAFIGQTQEESDFQIKKEGGQGTIY
jgi:hypothetical protein